MTAGEMDRAFAMLGSELQRRGVVGEILMAGGAWMVLVLGSREMTKDIDAYLAPPAHVIREAAAAVAEQMGIKGFFYTQPPQDLWKEYPGLRVYVVGADYMLALKAIAMRDQDREDLVALFRHLGLRSVDEVWAIIDRYIPSQLVPSGLPYFVESAWREFMA